MKKTCLITGGNSGIGKQAAIQLAQNQFHVIIGVRNVERGRTALKEIIDISGNKEVEMLQMDMSSHESILAASNNLSKQLNTLDVLIHNAADFDISRKKPIKSVDGIEITWATNHLGPVLLTQTILPLIKNSANGRIITIASKGLVMHPYLKVDLEDPEFEHRKFSVPKAYYQSKLAQLMYTYGLAKQLKDTPITVNCIRVTNVKIDTQRYPNISPFMKFLYRIKSTFSISAEAMAKTYTYLAMDMDVKNVTGKYFNEKNQIVSSSAYSKSKTEIAAVMDLTQKYLDKTGL